MAQADVSQQAITKKDKDHLNYWFYNLHLFILQISLVDPWISCQRTKIT